MITKTVGRLQAPLFARDNKLLDIPKVFRPALGRGGHATVVLEPHRDGRR
jgi:hypothetical protein